MNRDKAIEQLSTTPEWDIIIIGGGATGLGCAVDAASRGFKTLLLEKYDFAKGTSSRATKLVHGGVRYLEQGNSRLVKEALQERGRLLKNAPHVCHTLAFVVPVFSRFQKYYYGFGLWLYEWLSGKWSLGQTKLLSKQQTLDKLPGLDHTTLKGGILYYDGQFDDSRLAINLAQTATEQGATVINYFEVMGFIKASGKIKAVSGKDKLSGQTIELTAKVMINATGVFADELLQLAEGHKEETIAPSQGIHLVVDQHFFRADAGMMIPKTEDGRVLFAIPWHDHLLIGTTDTPVDVISAEPKPLQQEIDFVLHHFNKYAIASIHYRDVLSVFTGLRPLAKKGKGKKTAVMPRDHHVEVLPSGLVHVTGGKWTTYRSMAEHAVNKAIEVASLPKTNCRTKELRLHGWHQSKEPSHLSVYGSDATLIRMMIDDDQALAEKIHPDHPYIIAEIKWAIDNEMAMTVEDVLARRIRLLFLDAKAAMEATHKVATSMAQFLGKDNNWIDEQMTTFYELAKGYLIN